MNFDTALHPRPLHRRQLLARTTAAAAMVGLGTALESASASALGQVSPYPAPPLRGQGEWFNSAPLQLSSLRGKVVLIDFWTHACVNCLRTLPFVQRWHARFAAQGLVVIGVHTPEYAFERSPAAVAQAIERLGIRYPVMQDNAYGTWNAFRNQYWPAVYLVDRSGAVVFQHAGEGAYDEIEATLLRLLKTPAQGLAPTSGR